MDKASAACPFCGQVSREHPVTAAGLAALMGLYLAHLLESHWEQLAAAHDDRVAQGPVNDAWTRL